MRHLRRKRFIDFPVQGALVRRIVLHWLIFFTALLIVLPLWSIMQSGNLMGPFSKMMARSWVRKQRPLSSFSWP